MVSSVKVRQTTVRVAEKPEPIKSATAGVIEFRANSSGTVKTLSLFYGCPIVYKDMLFNSAIHLIAWFKCKNTEYRAIVLEARDANHACFCGSPIGMSFLTRHRDTKFVLRGDWPEVAVKLVTWTIKAKYQQNPALAEMLLKTGTRKLVEADNPHYWSLEQQPVNATGKLLTQVRKQLLDSSV